MDLARGSFGLMLAFAALPAWAPPAGAAQDPHDTIIANRVEWVWLPRVENGVVTGQWVPAIAMATAGLPEGYRFPAAPPTQTSPAPDAPTAATGTRSRLIEQASPNAPARTTVPPEFGEDSTVTWEEDITPVTPAPRKKHP